jgi:hypothetical protein
MAERARESRVRHDMGCPSPYHQKKERIRLREETVLVRISESIQDHCVLARVRKYDLKL